MVFATTGSDLEGLAVYDTNHDGQLSSADANFAQFAVWQDANSNGIVDSGEMTGLTAIGIASISLSSDGVGYSAANGDVSVVGTGSVTHADGSTGVLADAVFKTGALGAVQAGPAEPANSNNVLLAAIAAAGLAAAPAAAEVHSDQSLAPAEPESVVAQVADSHSQLAAGQSSVTARIVDKLQAAADAHDAVKYSTHGQGDDAPASDGHALGGSEAANQSVPADLLAATAAPAHPEPASVMAPGVAMPSIEQLQAMDHAAAPAARRRTSRMKSSARSWSTRSTGEVALPRSTSC